MPRAAYPHRLPHHPAHRFHPAAPLLVARAAHPLRPHAAQRLAPPPTPPIAPPAPAASSQRHKRTRGPRLPERDESRACDGTASSTWRAVVHPPQQVAGASSQLPQRAPPQSGLCQDFVFSTANFDAQISSGTANFGKILILAERSLLRKFCQNVPSHHRQVCASSQPATSCRACSPALLVKVDRILWCEGANLVGDVM